MVPHVTFLEGKGTHNKKNNVYIHYICFPTACTMQIPLSWTRVPSGK